MENCNKYEEAVKYIVEDFNKRRTKEQEIMKEYEQKPIEEAIKKFNENYKLFALSVQNILRNGGFIE